ncbi:MAG: ATP-binding protein [Angustibacter sp.]
MTAHGSPDWTSSVRDNVGSRTGVVIGELGGNAVRHGRPPVEVRLIRLADGWLLEVLDGAPEHPPGPRSGHVDAEGGFGLGLVRTLARSVGWWAEDGRKVVWAHVGDQPPTSLLSTLDRHLITAPDGCEARRDEPQRDTEEEP